MMHTRVPELEADLGIEVYASQSKGIGGRIRCSPDDFIVEETLTDGSKASVQLTKKTVLPSGHGRYLLCILTKKGWDTLAAIRKIAKQLGASPERINIAGMKDARALTAQHMSIGGVPPKRVLDVSIKEMTVNPVGFSSEKISSKLLFGNHFDITVRHVKCKSSTVQRRIEKTREELADLRGIPNFFGHQRFGTVRPITHLVGRCLVKGNFEDAVLIFVSEASRHEHPEARKARKRLQETRDFRIALKFFPKKLMYERLMLRHLARYPRDFLGALHRLPQSLRRLFVQAYQSFLFNRFLSERMKRGLPIRTAQIGDYVVSLDEEGLPTNSFKKTEEHNFLRINKEIGERKMAVTIPLIGFKQSPSEGAQGEIEEEILEEEDVTPQDFHMQKMPEASASGGLRAVLTPTLDLNVDEERPADSNGLSVKFSFTLHKGSYATVLLREYMKPEDLIKAGF